MKILPTVSGETLSEILASAKVQFDRFFAGRWYEMTPLVARPSARIPNYGGAGVVLLWEIEFEAVSKPDIVPDE